MRERARAAQLLLAAPATGWDRGVQATGPRLDDAAIEGEGRLAEGAGSLLIGRPHEHEVERHATWLRRRRVLFCGSLSWAGAWRELRGFWRQNFRTSIRVYVIKDTSRVNFTGDISFLIIRP